jgi:hypothetical protein
VPVYEPTSLRGPWSRLVGGWWEAEEEKKRRKRREKREVFIAGPEDVMEVSWQPA